MAASASAPSTTRGPGRLNQAEASTAQTAPRVAAGSARQAGWSQSRRAWAATASNEKPQGRAHVLGANIELRGLDENRMRLTKRSARTPMDAAVARSMAAAEALRLTL